MPRKETVLNIFTASPSDVADERKALELITQELNKTWSKSLNLRLDLIKWETDSYPGFENHPQDVINHQINDEYDIFIAIFWGKIGTPTSQAESGTIEELERALKKHKINNDSVDIMIYFKDQPISPSKMNPEQLIKLQSLKDSIGPKGGLYWTFESTDEFTTLLRTHLSKIAQKWAHQLQDPATATIENSLGIHSPVQLKADEEDGDYGLLDYQDIFEDRISMMNLGLESLGAATTLVGEQFNKRAEELNSLENGDLSNASRRKIIKLSSDDLNNYSRVLETHTPAISRAREEAFEALSKAMALHIDIISPDESEITELAHAIQQMTASAQDSLLGVVGFRSSLTALPRLTVEINRSKRRAVQALESVIEEIEKSVQSANEILKLLYTIQ